MGYHMAGFDVVGMDINPQPHYPFPFVQGDVMELLEQEEWWDGFDAVHASPPCQAHTTMSNRWRGYGGKADNRSDLLSPTLKHFADLPIPWVVENVQGAKNIMPNPIILHGGMFDLLVNRPRLFSSNINLIVFKYPRVKNPVGVYGKSPDGRLLFLRADETAQFCVSSVEEAQEAMGMWWGDWYGVKEAIPPLYTEFIGLQLLSCQP